MTDCAIGLMQSWLRMGSFSKKQTFFYFTHKFHKQLLIRPEKSCLPKRSKEFEIYFLDLNFWHYKSMSHFNTLITSNGEEIEQLAKCRIGRECVFMFLRQLSFYIKHSLHGVLWMTDCAIGLMQNWLRMGSFILKNLFFTSRINFTNSS